jgi:peptidoglycan-N-acetylglucosamine deacetylase
MDEDRRDPADDSCGINLQDGLGEGRPADGSSHSQEDEPSAPIQLPRMSVRRKVRGLVPRSLRQRIYDSRRSGRRAWRQTPGIETVPPTAGAALTFDDGPDPEFTPPLLDALAAAGASATFFVVGERVAGNERLLREMESRGHEIALHGMRHRRHDRLGDEEARAELTEGLAAIEAAAVTRPRRYRPPYGGTSPALARFCGELGLELAYWSAWGQDWEPLSAARIAQLVDRDLGPGTVILLHDSALYAERADTGPTIEAVPLIGGAARERGIALVSLQQAFASKED